eukprot:TRINITY_DN1315_c0_g1_i2.p1 TRINITY_DN1315_c0_g1~~TRINITY_DN1315_c0_g1_i2.p1  ORF type:complete len:762 (+),score=83.73 TRINITY_DN1315_c0_g1_i2:1279-3564(+)
MSHNDTLVEFCGSDGFSPWVDNRFGFCFREFIIGGIPALIILIGGCIRLFYLLTIRKNIKRKVKILGEQQQQHDLHEHRRHLQARKKIWFWIKFLISTLLLLLSQAEMTFYSVVSPEGHLQSVVASDVLRAVSWAMSALVMYLEYKTRLPTSNILRVYWIIQGVSGLLQESSILTKELTEPDPEVMHIPNLMFHFAVLLQIVLAIMGSIGFSKRYERFWEPIVHPKMLQKREKKFSIKELFKLIWPNWILWSSAILFCTAEGVLTVMYLQTVSDIVDLVDPEDVSEETWNQLKTMVITFFAQASAAGVCSFLQAALFGRAGYNMVENIRNDMMASLMKQEMAYFDTTSPGSLISNLSSDTDKVGRLKEVIPMIINPLAQVIYGGVVLLQTSWQLTSVILALLVLEFVEATVRSRQVSHKYSLKYSLINTEVADRGTEILSSIQTVRLFVQEKKETESYAKFAHQAGDIARKKEVLEAIFEAIEYVLYAAIIGVGVIYSYNLIQLRVGFPAKGLTDFILIGVTMVTQFQEVIKAVPDFASASGPAALLVKIIDREPAFANDVGKSLDHLEGTIEFKNMSFKYPVIHAPTSLLSSSNEPTELGNNATISKQKKKSGGGGGGGGGGPSSSLKKKGNDEELYIFKDFSLKIVPGTSAAFVGPSGCGKSTLFSLLLRSYDVTDGAVVIDGSHDLRNLNQTWWLRNVGVVTQEARIFKGTLRDNILYGIEEKDRNNIPDLEERLMDAVAKANLQKLVEDKGLDFQVI